ncbi:MAG: GGDEF domain-containing protein [Lachnospiraceae bacterium]|nr:GGDEF domain-containing protein [Lachnospiraceae bacterium]
MYYASFGILSLVIHIIIHFDSMKKPRGKEQYQVRNRYRVFLFSALLYYVFDVVWGFTSETNVIPVEYAYSVLYFVVMALTVLLWMRMIVAFLGKSKAFCNVVSVAGWCVFGLVIAMIIANFFRPVLFYFDSDGEYYAGIAKLVVFGMQILLFVVLAAFSLIRSFRVSKQERLHYRAIGISGLVMALFIGLQLVFTNLPLYTIGCLLATCIIHSFVQLDAKANFDQELGSVKQIAYKDPLTNVRNKNAYVEAKKACESKMWNKSLRELGVVVFDVNDLKKTNDTMGHEAGDKLIREASNMICDTYKHSPVFRIGGDEFVVLLEGEDFRNRAFLLRLFNEKSDSNLKFGGPVVSAGMDIFDLERDLSIDDIFERADNKMYERKKELKKKANTPTYR